MTWPIVCRFQEGGSWVISAFGQPQRAARLGGAAAALREALGVPLLRERQATHEQGEQAVRTVLGEEAFAAAWAAGQVMPPEVAIVYALDDKAGQSDAGGGKEGSSY